jgi:hypothetical protein
LKSFSSAALCRAVANLLYILIPLLGSSPPIKHLRLLLNQKAVVAAACVQRPNQQACLNMGFGALAYVKNWASYIAILADAKRGSSSFDVGREDLRFETHTDAEDGLNMESGYKILTCEPRSLQIHRGTVRWFGFSLFRKWH